MSEPKPYDMRNRKDRIRWFKEMKGYLEVDKFKINGTDGMGRMYAAEAFIDLEKICTENKFKCNTCGEKFPDVATALLHVTDSETIQSYDDMHHVVPMRGVEIVVKEDEGAD